MKLAIKDPAVEASASPGDNLAMKLAVRPSANGKGEIAFLEVQNLTELPVTAFAVRSAGPMPESALLLPGTASAGRVGGVGDFTATFMAPRGALVELEGIQVDYVAPALGMDDIAPGKTQRILQFTAPLVKTTRLDTTAILFGDGSSAGDAKIIKEILDARLRTLNSIAAVKPLLATAGLGQTGGKAVQKKTDELLKKKGGPQLSADSHHLIRAIWEQVDQLSAKAAPADTEKLVTSFLADLESKLKRSKPALAQ